MRRRDLVKSAAAVALAPFAPSAVFAALPARRVRPGDSGWPSDADWARLKAEVGGRLTRPRPIAAACQADAGGADCALLKHNLTNPYFIGDQAGGTQVSGWLDAWTPQVSAWAVEARDSADVVAAVNFARRHNLRLVVKGGGHSYQGLSNAPDSLLVWTRPMNAIVVHDAFTPAGGAGGGVPAVSIGAGAVWADAYDAVTTRAGRYVQGGGCATVGCAGLVLGGGFGSFSKGYGTAAASLIEAEIVTADGQARIVNASQDPDLFWALKGAGQGSLGVVTRVTLATHPLADTAGGFSAAIQAHDAAAFRRLIDAFLELSATTLVNRHWGESVSLLGSNALHVSMVFQGIDSTAAKAAWAPFFQRLAESPADFTVKGPRVLDRPMRQWWGFAADRPLHLPFEVYDPRPGASAQHAWWSGDSDQVSAFFYGYESLWLPDSLLTAGARGRLADALFQATRHTDVDLHFNKGLAGAPPDVLAAARDTATNPAVLDAFALAIIATGGHPNYPGFPATNVVRARAEARSIDAATAALRPLAPGGGSYVAESNFFNAHWPTAFWGGHYQRLSAIKRRYDPEGLFIVHHGVGSENWSADGFTRRA